MLQLLGSALPGLLFIFAMTTLGSGMVFFISGPPEPNLQKCTLGFAAGVMTAASVWSLLLPAMEQAGDLPPWLPAGAGVLLGALFLALLDALLPRLTRWQEDTCRRADRLLMLAITLHNIPEGMAVGLAFARAADGGGLAAAAALALGVGIQNFPEGTAIALPLYQSGGSRRRAFLGGVLSGVVEPAAGLLTVLLAVAVAPLMPWLLSFAAGAMLYVVVEELVPQAHSRAGTCAFLLGFLVMMVLDVALGA